MASSHAEKCLGNEVAPTFTAGLPDFEADIPSSSGANMKLNGTVGPYKPLPPLPAWALETEADNADTTELRGRLTNMTVSATNLVGKAAAPVVDTGYKPLPALPAWALEPDSPSDASNSMFERSETVEGAFSSQNSLVGAFATPQAPVFGRPAAPAQYTGPMVPADDKRDPATRKLDYLLCMHTVIKMCPAKDALLVVRGMMDAGTVNVHDKLCLANKDIISMTPDTADIPSRYAMISRLKTKAKAGIATSTDAALTMKVQRAEARTAALTDGSVYMDALTAAASVGAGLLVVYFLSKGANVNATDSLGATPLHHAAMRDCQDVVSILVRAGANINAIDDEGLTPLHSAVSAHLPDLAALLLKMGADVNISEDVTGLTPLHTAKDAATLSVLLRSVEFAAQGRKENIMSKHYRALEGGIVPQLDRRSARGWTPLHVFASSGSAVCMKLILQAGADVDADSDIGETPLFAACRSGSLCAVEVLLAAGANANQVNHGGLTPFHLAAALETSDTALQICLSLYKAGARTLCATAGQAKKCAKCRLCLKRVQDLCALTTVAATPSATIAEIPAGKTDVIPDLEDDPVVSKSAKRKRKRARRKGQAVGIPDTEASSLPAVPPGLVMIVGDDTDDESEDGDEVDWDEVSNSLK